jgi:hypothetical protein
MKRLFPWLLILVGVAMMAGCALPVYVRPEMSEGNKPIPVAVQPVAPSPASHDPAWADAADKPAAPAFDWGMILAVLGGVAGVAGGGWGVIAQRGLTVVRTALGAAVEYGNEAETIDPKNKSELDALKAKHAAKQQARGVHAVIAAELNK